jgi:class 3 adenylate cyclase
MRSPGGSWDVVSSAGRIDEILAASDAAYQEVDRIPDRDGLTFMNGYYVNCSAVFVDMRESSKLGESYRRPTLAKLYRVYISELVALFNADPLCKDLNIHGDAVWAVFDSPYKTNIDDVFSRAVMARSLIDVLNCRLVRYGLAAVTAGVGMSYGRALMIKAGYKGSAINEVVWMGDVVNEAAHLAHDARRGWAGPPMLMSHVFFSNLNEHNSTLCQTWSGRWGVYQSSAVNTVIHGWLRANCN